MNGIHNINKFSLLNKYLLKINDNYYIMNRKQTNLDLKKCIQTALLPVVNESLLRMVVVSEVIGVMAGSSFHAFGVIALK